MASEEDRRRRQQRQERDDVWVEQNRDQSTCQGCGRSLYPTEKFFVYQGRPGRFCSAACAATVKE